jgi:two-component system, chemotaxis family, chemotaxis protein CheY
VPSVFIIGDNLLIRTLLREILSEDGYEVLGDAKNTPAALPKVLEARPDVVLLDLVLLRTPGLAMLRHLVTIDRQMPVIVCAALLERSNTIAALRLGASGFILKPFNRYTVLDAVGDALAQKTAAGAVVEADAANVPTTDDAADHVEQRQFVRIAAALPVTLRTADGQRLETVTVDISGGGMLLAEGRLERDAQVDFRLQLGRREAPVDGRARVVRITPDGRPALAFELVHIADHERLIELIAGYAKTANS